MKHIITKIRLNIKYILQKSTSIVCILYAFLGFLGSFVSLGEMLPAQITFWVKLRISFYILGGVWLFSCIMVSVFVVIKKRYEVISANGSHKLYVQYGDIFNPDEVLNADERRNIIIPVNRCFDTKVDNRLISDRTLHGIAFTKLYTTGRYTEESLNKSIQNALVHENYEELEVAEKPEGNRKRFPVGTVVDLPGDDNEHLLLWALSTFDERLKAHTSMQEYALAVQKLVEACNAESEGYPVLIPLIGTGLSRTNKDQQAILDYLIEAFRLNRESINCDIHIIIREDIKSDISIVNLK